MPEGVAVESTARAAAQLEAAALALLCSSPAAACTNILVTKGASADTSYDKGVAVFTNASGGLMVEGSVGGQKFTYEPKK